MSDGDGTADGYGRLVAVELDPDSIGRSGPDVEQERAAAIHDLVTTSRFRPAGRPPEDFRLRLGVVDRRLAFEVRHADGRDVALHLLSLTPFRRLVQDYFLICDSYFAAIRTATAGRIEAIDMGRRGVHDEGSRLLQERLAGKIEVDFETARRLFTLICALHWKG